MTTAYDVWIGALARLGWNFEDGLLGDNDDVGVLSLLNDGLAEMSVDHDWLFAFGEETFDIEAGVDVYNTPLDWLRTSFLINQDGNYELYPLQRREHHTMLPGVPRFYDTSGDRILIAPTPTEDGTLLHGYFTSIPRVVRNATLYPEVYDQLAAVTLNLPDPYTSLAVLYVAKNAALRIKDREAYQMVNEELASFRRKIEDNRRRQQAQPRVRARQDLYLR